MAFERQIGAVELQEEPGLDDRLVLLAQCHAEGVKIGRFGVVMLVLHRPGDDAGRGCRQERLGELRAGIVERRAEIGALGFDSTAAEIAHGANRLGRPHVADRLAAGKLRLHDRLEDRVAQRVGAGAPLPRPAKPAHPVADVQKEALALLLAIVGDVDPGLGLPAHDRAQRRLP